MIYVVDRRLTIYRYDRSARETGNNVRLNLWACLQRRRHLIFVFRDREEEDHLVCLCFREIVRENNDREICILLLD